MNALVVRRLDGRLVLELPDDIAKQIGLAEGDVLSAKREADGTVNLSAYDEKTARQIKHGLRAMSRFEATFKALAQ